MDEIPVLLLAAGCSSRMGQPKQLLPWGETTLLEYQVKMLVKTGNPVNVVLGFNSDVFTPLIEKYPVNIIVNKNWMSGIGSSVSCGISHVIKEFPGAKAVLIALLDQPLVTSDYYNKVLNTYQPMFNQIIVSQSSEGWKGVPVLFDKCYFKELSDLKGEEGAKKVFLSHNTNVIAIEAGEMLDDLDSREGYEKLLAKFNRQ